MLSPTTAKALLLDAVQAELEADGTAKGLCMVSVMPGGAVPLDYGAESCGGMVWVRLTQAFPTQEFPQQATTLNNCGYDLALALEVGVMRPAPMPTDFQGDIELPPAEEHFEAAALQDRDMEAVHRAVKALAQRIEYVVLGSYEPVGPDGGTVGGTWTLTVGGDLED